MVSEGFCQRRCNMSLSRIIPVCPFLGSNYMTRLSTFSHVSGHCRMRNISAILLAGSGIIYSAEEDWLECTHCAKITMLFNAPATPSLYALIKYHRDNCPGYSHFIEIKERERREEAVNLHQMKRNYRRTPTVGNLTYNEPPQMFGNTQQ